MSCRLFMGLCYPHAAARCAQRLTTRPVSQNWSIVTDPTFTSATRCRFRSKLFSAMAFVKVNIFLGFDVLTGLNYLKITKIRSIDCSRVKNGKIAKLMSLPNNVVGTLANYILIPTFCQPFSSIKWDRQTSLTKPINRRAPQSHRPFLTRRAVMG